jgi:NAD+ diphosphatase
VTHNPLARTFPHFIPGITTPDELLGRPAYWFAFCGSKLLVRGDGEQVEVPHVASLQELGLEPLRAHYLGALQGTPCYSAELPPGSEAPAGMMFDGLRGLYGLLADDFFWLAARAVQIVDWDRTHQFCGVCGARTESSSHERVKRCPRCGQTSYPRLAPAIIVAITRGDKLLLAHNHRHPRGLYSVLAGFVEPGETLEACLVREVKEEVGIDVKNIRYFGSQPWPFPHSLMIAFTCEYAGGELVLEDEEIADAQWFSADNLPNVPPPISIARRLIDWFVEEVG